MAEIIGYDLFCGAGGMSIGAEMAGIKIKFAVDFNKYAINTYKQNHVNIDVIESDIRDISAKVYKTNQALVIFGGPPCQGFSVSNKKTRTINNLNNHLFREFIRFVRDLNPDWFVFENVQGILSFEKGAVVDKLHTSFRELGYRTKHAVLLASDFGVPQNRNRFFLIGNNGGINFNFPSPTTTNKITVWQAISDLPRLKNGDNYDELDYYSEKLNNFTKIMRNGSKKAKQNYVTKNNELTIKRYKHIKQGENWRAIPSFLMKNYKNKENCHSGIYKRLEKHKPSVVIANYRKNMLIHPTQNRGLSLREAARLQSFPDDFLFLGIKGSQQQQIGNAVPPLLAKAVFQKILSYY